MEKANIAPFYVGQKVVCIRPNHRLIKNAEYTISHIITCKCGFTCVCVGLQDGVFECTATCCGRAYKGNGFAEFLPTRFVPSQQQNFPLIKLSEIRIKETEKVEPILIGEN